MCASGCVDCNSGSQCHNDHPDGSGADNECTLDTCGPVCGGCEHTPYNEVGVECCDPDTGVINPGPIDDGDPCTIDTCNLLTGEITHTPTDPCPGRCCYAYATCAGPACADGKTQAKCDARPGVTNWVTLETCSGDIQADCAPYQPAVPAVSTWGLVVLTLLAIAVGTVALSRRVRLRDVHVREG